MNLCLWRRPRSALFSVVERCLSVTALQMTLLGVHLDESRSNGVNGLAAPALGAGLGLPPRWPPRPACRRGSINHAKWSPRGRSSAPPSSATCSSSATAGTATTGTCAPSASTAKPTIPVYDVLQRSHRFAFVTPR
jgi:hypothetical protein